MARKHNVDVDPVSTVEEDITEEAAKEKAVEAEKTAKRLLRSSAKKRIRAIINATNDDQAKTDLILLIGKGERTGRISGMSSDSSILKYIQKSTPQGASEMDIFKEFKIGRPEMKSKLRTFVKTTNPDDRVWVKFFEDEEVYRVVAEGADAPEGWEGFTPPSTENIL